MKVLVTGDRGYIGAVLVPLFREAGHEVVGLDIGWYDGCDFGPYTPDYESRTGDIRDQRPEDVAGFDAVVNLAAISNDPVGHLNPDATYSVNAHGAAHLARGREGGGRAALRSSPPRARSTERPATHRSPRRATSTRSRRTARAR